MGDTDIEQRCLELIDENGTDSLKSDGFKNLKVETLKRIISRDTLNIKESDVWLACAEWAVKECTRLGKQVRRIIACMSKIFIHTESWLPSLYLTILYFW